ncbi:NAD(P)H-hydrate dehydratase [Candidatus Bathyarchaeota archaeon]|nr:NAD(P)H-hydrate dehydratase [Candidatus Bathyarchaeota archaeon]
MILNEFLSAKDMRAIEANSNYLGISNRILMENAGKAVSDIIVSRYALPKTVSVICGLGGNGGDGLVAARHLASQGYQIKVIFVGDPSLIHSDETRANYSIISQMKSSIEFLVIKDSSEIIPLNSDIYVDSLIGYNFKGALSPLIRAAVNSINQAKGIKISVDVPTGINADTGEPTEEYVKADLTVTFHKMKLGFKKKPTNFGEIKVASVGIPLEAEIYVGPGDVLKIHKDRPPESHKGMFGRLLVIAGSSQYSGAPLLTTMGAYSVGLDLVYTAIPDKIGDTVSSYSPSIISVKYPQENLTEESIEFLNPIIEKIDAVAIGPGLGLHSETKKAVTQIISICDKKKIPMLIDADALKAYGEIRKKVKTPTVFTPHSKEFEILTGKIVEGTPENKTEIVQKEAKKLGAVILLKGNVDIISDGTKTRLNWTGNPGMTVGGTGDVLSGIVAGYLAQKAEPIEAAAAGAFINGAAGDIIKKEKGYHILPEDLIKVIPTVIENAINGKIKM